MLESLFVSNTFSKYIRTDTNAQPIRLLLNRISNYASLYTERNNNRILKSLVAAGWIRTSDLRLMRTTRWTTSLPRNILFPFLLYIYYNKNFLKSQIFVCGACGRG